MAGYLLDTNHLGRWIDPRHPLRARILVAIRRGCAFYIVLPVLTETIVGFSILPRATQNWAEWQVLRPAITLLPLDKADGVNAARLLVALRRAGRQLGTPYLHPYHHRRAP